MFFLLRNMPLLVLLVQQPTEEGLPTEYCPCKTLAEWSEYVQRAPLMVCPHHTLQTELPIAY
jgi:hypothetical protein